MERHRGVSPWGALRFGEQICSSIYETEHRALRWRHRFVISLPNLALWSPP